MIGLLQDQRRAQRLPIYLPVQVYGKLDGVPFSEATETINVSACGGLVPISAGVVRAQKLILTNLQTNQDLPCRVARLIRSERGQMLAGLEFLQSAPGFWRSSPPPRTTDRHPNSSVPPTARLSYHSRKLLSDAGFFRM